MVLLYSMFNSVVQLVKTIDKPFLYVTFKCIEIGLNL
jgi:hypothetical protein